MHIGDTKFSLIAFPSQSRADGLLVHIQANLASRTPLFRSPTGRENKFEIAGFRNNWVGTKWWSNEGESAWLRNSGDFELTEFQIARFDCRTEKGRGTFGRNIGPTQAVRVLDLAGFSMTLLFPQRLAEPSRFSWLEEKNIFMEPPKPQIRDETTWDKIISKSPFSMKSNDWQTIMKRNVYALLDPLPPSSPSHIWKIVPTKGGGGRCGRMLWNKVCWCGKAFVPVWNFRLLTKPSEAGDMLPHIIS